MSESGFVVCADITGYTAYLSGSELDHASGTLGDLLNLLLGETKPPLHLSRVEGDAVISYAQSEEGVTPHLVVDRLEATYVAFRRALEQMILNTTCQCTACSNIGSLDLKFVVHHGSFVVQHLGNQDELVGSDVNFLFRRVKNRINQEHGISGYVAFTEAAAGALQLPTYVSQLLPHTEDDPEQGSVVLLVRDMAPVWETKRRMRFRGIEHAVVESGLDLPVSLTRAWAYLTRPATRAVVFGADRMEVKSLADGRIGPEATYVCFHGASQVTHTIVDWDPPYRYTFLTQIPGGLTLPVEFSLERLGDAATRLTSRAGPPRGGKVKAKLAGPISRRIAASVARKGFARLTALIEQDLGQQE